MVGAMERAGTALMRNHPMVKVLPSGHWHVRFGRNLFVQWPRGRDAIAYDVFGGPDVKAHLARMANEASGSAVGSSTKWSRRVEVS